MTGLTELASNVVKALVDRPESVAVAIKNGQRRVLVEVRVAPEDRGKVIGRRGRLANALRVLLAAVAAKYGKTATLDIIE